MGIYDRDYYREPQSQTSSVGSLRMLSVNTWLIIINVAVFVIDIVLLKAHIVVVELIPTPPGEPPVGIQQLFLNGWGHFSFWLAIQHFQIWRFITFQFIHANINHIFFNMLALYFFGPFIESVLGSRRYLAFYLLCGIGGPIAYVLLWMSHLLISASWTPLVGASAGIFGVLIAAAQVAPNTTVLVYGVLPVKLKTMAYVLLGIALYTVLFMGQSGQGNAGGEAAHLGGAAVGWFLMRNVRLLNFAEGAMPGRRRRPF